MRFRGGGAIRGLKVPGPHRGRTWCTYAVKAYTGEGGETETERRESRCASYEGKEKHAPVRGEFSAYLFSISSPAVHRPFSPCPEERATSARISGGAGTPLACGGIARIGTTEEKTSRGTRKNGNTNAGGLGYLKQTGEIEHETCCYAPMAHKRSCLGLPTRTASSSPVRPHPQ